MHQAMKPENKPAQHSAKAMERIGPHSAAPLRSAPSSARTTRPATAQPAQAESSRAALSGTSTGPSAENAQVSSSTGNSNSDASASVDPDSNPGFDLSTSNFQAASAAAELVGATSPGTAVHSASYPAGKSVDTSAKDAGADLHGAPKTSTAPSPAAPAPVASGTPPAITIVLPLKSLNDNSREISHLSTMGSSTKPSGTQVESGWKANAETASTFAAGAAHSVSETSKNFSGAGATTAAAANMSTTVSSSDLLLNSTDETASSAQSFASDSGDASLLNGVASGDVAGVAGNGTSTNTASKVPDALGNFAGAGTAADAATMTAAATHAAPGHPGAPGQPGSIDSISAGTPAAAGQTGPANGNTGNISSVHTGSSSTMPNARIAERGVPATMSPSATFSAMDRAGSSTGESLLHASPNQVTVGVADSGMGWIEVRAERVGGQVTAALTANSATAHAELTSVLPAMSSYLQDHRQPVQQIYVETGQAASHNAGGSQEQARGGRRDQGDAPQAVTGISGVGGPSRTSGMRSTQHTSHAVEATQGSAKAEGHQLSVRA